MIFNLSMYVRNLILIFRIYEEHKKRQMKLKQQYSRIEAQLSFEDENDTESKFPNHIFVNVSSLI